MRLGGTVLGATREEPRRVGRGGFEKDCGAGVEQARVEAARRRLEESDAGIEEIAAGLYLNSQYELGLGSQFILDGASCTVVSAGLVHMQVARGGVVHRIAYSRILKSDFAPAPGPGEEL